LEWNAHRKDELTGQVEDVRARHNRATSLKSRQQEAPLGSQAFTKGAAPMPHAKNVHASLLSQALIGRLGDTYEERILRIIAQEELFPLTEQKTAPDLAESFHGIFKC
jgi:hypothetical protein